MRRSDVRYELLSVQGGLKHCPLCIYLFPGTPACFGIRYHEIIYLSEHDRRKYSDKPTELAEALFVPALGILLCDRCNGHIGSGHEYIEALLKMKLQDTNYDPEDILTALRNVAKLLTLPYQWIPRTLEVQGVTYTI